jgi:hypothetical protein
VNFFYRKTSLPLVTGGELVPGLCLDVGVNATEESRQAGLCRVAESYDNNDKRSRTNGAGYCDK